MGTESRYQGVGRAAVAGCDMVAAVGVGGLLGWWIDRLTGWWPWCFLAGFVLGTVAGFRMVYIKLMAPLPGHEPKESRQHD